VIGCNARPATRSRVKLLIQTLVFLQPRDGYAAQSALSSNLLLYFPKRDRRSSESSNKRSDSSRAMKSRVTVTAQGDQFVFGIFPGMTPKVLMMNLESLVALRSIGIAIHPAQESFCKAAGKKSRRTGRCFDRIELTKRCGLRAPGICVAVRRVETKKLVIDLSKISGFRRPDLLRPGSQRRSSPGSWT
jgi:hypothetical protein